MKIKKTVLWQAISFALAIALVASIYTGGFKAGESSEAKEDSTTAITGDFVVVTWSEDETVYSTISNQFSELCIGTSGTDTATNLQVLPFIIAVK